LSSHHLRCAEEMRGRAEQFGGCLKLYEWVEESL
jgi:hypothetical protein